MPGCLLEIIFHRPHGHNDSVSVEKEGIFPYSSSQLGYFDKKNKGLPMIKATIIPDNLISLVLWVTGTCQTNTGKVDRIKPNYTNRKSFILVNPSAGKFRTDRVYPSIEAYILNKGITFQSFFSSIHKNISATIKENLDKSFTDLVVIGGDGTLNEAINALQDFSLPIGVIQAGTGNDFSKNFFRKYSLQKQLETALHGQIKKVDVGICNGRFFLNGVGVGFDGAVTRAMVENSSTNKGHLSYWGQVLKLLFNYKAPQLHITSEAHSFNEEAFLATVGNGTTFGGGFKLTPYAKTDDGMLDLCVIKKAAVTQRIFRMLMVLQGRHPEMEMCEYLKTGQLKISCNDIVDAHIDGEWFQDNNFEIEIRPSILPLRVPG